MCTYHLFVRNNLDRLYNEIYKNFDCNNYILRWNFNNTYTNRCENYSSYIELNVFINLFIWKIHNIFNKELKLDKLYLNSFLIPCYINIVEKNEKKYLQFLNINVEKSVNKTLNSSFLSDVKKNYLMIYEYVCCHDKKNINLTQCKITKYKIDFDIDMEKRYKIEFIDVEYYIKENLESTKYFIKVIKRLFNPVINVNNKIIYNTKFNFFNSFPTYVELFQI